jgi:hypothetical protein
LRAQERVKEPECSWKYVLMYENGKMRPVETIPGMQRWGEYGDKKE